MTRRTRTNIRKVANFVADKAGALALIAVFSSALWVIGNIAVPTGIQGVSRTAFERVGRYADPGNSEDYQRQTVGRDAVCVDYSDIGMRDADCDGSRLTPLQIPKNFYPPEFDQYDYDNPGEDREGDREGSGSGGIGY